MKAESAAGIAFNFESDFRYQPSFLKEESL